MSAERPTAGGERFSERISVMAVEIPVRVILDGRPLGGLTADDFQVMEGGSEHAIVGFEEIVLTGTEESSAVDVGSEAVDAAGNLEPRGRSLLLVLDTAYSSRKHLLRAARAAERLVEADLHPGDRVALATYSGIGGLRFVTGFTADRELIRLALEAFRTGLGGEKKKRREVLERLGARLRDRRTSSPLERFRLLSEEFGQSAAIAFESSMADLGLGGDGPGSRGLLDGLVGRRFAAAETVGDPVLRGFQNTDPAQIASGLAEGLGRSGVRTLSLELSEMATVLRDLPGPKHLLLFSQGFASGLLEDATALFHLERALEALRRANWAIQAIDIEGVPESRAPGFGASSLFYLANETGGELIENFNNLERAGARILERTAVSYVLTIQPTDVPADGRYRELQVRLRDGVPRRARVLHRPGYYTPKPFGAQSVLEKTLAAAALLLSDRELTQLQVAVLAMALTGDAPMQVPVVVEVPASELREGGRGGASLEFHAYALDGAGEIQDLFSQRLRLDRRELAALRRAGSGVRLYDRLALPAGDYSLRLLVRDLETGDAYLGTHPLEVRAQPVGPVLDRPLFVLDSGWLELRGAGNLNGGRGVDHPFVLAGRPRIPAVDPVLAPGQEASVFFTLRRAVDPDLTISARVLDAGGEPMAAGRLELREKILGRGGEVEALLGTFSAAGLPPGGYRLEVTASWNGGAGASTRRSDFRIAG